MGAWDTGPFDNDDAGDWSSQLDGAADDAATVEVVRAALRDAADSTSYLERDLGGPAVAAAAVVAAARGGPATDPSCGPKVPLPTLPPELAPLALRALDRVVADDSELRELWAESESLDDWLASLAPIRAALQ